MALEKNKSTEAKMIAKSHQITINDLIKRKQEILSFWKKGQSL
jgi:hypothetical protein